MEKKGFILDHIIDKFLDIKAKDTNSLVKLEG